MRPASEFLDERIQRNAGILQKPFQEAATQFSAGMVGHNDDATVRMLEDDMTAHLPIDSKPQPEQGSFDLAVRQGANAARHAYTETLTLSTPT